LRQTADRPLAALHERPALFRNSLLACAPPEELDPAFVVAVLNGPLASAWHQTRQRDARQRCFPQVKVGHLRTQPFPIQRRSQAPRLHDQVAELARRPGASQDPQLERLLLQAFELDERMGAALRERCPQGTASSAE